MKRVLVVFFAIFFALSGGSLFGDGLTPTSPEVRRAVDNAVKFLLKEGAKEQRLGGRVLVCLALLKADVPKNHPFIELTVKEIQKSIADDGTISFKYPIYTAGLMVIFLADLEPDLYHRELVALRQFLLNNQRKDGSWTYLTSGTADAYPSGDMSMTQYGVMALWTLHQLGHDIPGEAVDRMGRWLVYAQTSEGSYAYQTKMSDDFRQISHESIRLSMSTAGMASVYVCRDLFGFNEKRQTTGAKKKALAAFMEKQTEELSTRSIEGYAFKTTKERLEAVQKRGNAWMARNVFPVTQSVPYFYYYLYAMERYGAFFELSETKQLSSPRWYDRIAEKLLQLQDEQGFWKGPLLGEQVDTSYSVLFLVRSTRRTFSKTYDRVGGGNLIGGRGLPRMTDHVVVENGQIVSLSEITGPKQLLERLEELDMDDEETLAKLAQLPESEVEHLLNRNKARIKSLVGDEKAEKRLIAVTMLGKSGDVANAEALIYALSDPDPDVVRAAHAALLRLARDPKDSALDAKDAAEWEKKRQQVVQRWQTWYRKIDPDAVFEAP